MPAGTPRRASQRRSRPAAAAPTITGPRWKPGNPVIWRDCVGKFLHEVEDGFGHVLIAGRTYRAPLAELRPADAAP